MQNRLKVAVAVVAIAVLVGVASALGAAGHSHARAAKGITVPVGTYTIRTTLTSTAEVPRPKGAAGAKGLFTGTLKVIRANRGTLTWRLTFTHLTGPALAAHIHIGALHTAGKIAVPLCAPCTSGAHGTKSPSATTLSAMILGKTYVNVHTKANPGGEIRGQIIPKNISTGGGGGNPYANITVTVTPALVAKGKALSAKYSCEGCHTLNGQQSTGPTWKGLAGRNVKLTNGKTVKATDGYLILAILQPDAEIVSGYSSGVMTTAIGNIPLSEAKAITAYIKTIK